MNEFYLFIYSPASWKAGYTNYIKCRTCAIKLPMNKTHRNNWAFFFLNLSLSFSWERLPSLIIYTNTKAFQSFKHTSNAYLTFQNQVKALFILALNTCSWLYIPACSTKNGHKPRCVFFKHTSLFTKTGGQSTVLLSKIKTFSIKVILRKQKACDVIYQVSTFNTVDRETVLEKWIQLFLTYKQVFVTFSLWNVSATD